MNFVRHAKNSSLNIYLQLIFHTVSEETFNYPNHEVSSISFSRTPHQVNQTMPTIRNSLAFIFSSIRTVICGKVPSGSKMNQIVFLPCDFKNPWQAGALANGNGAHLLCIRVLRKLETGGCTYYRYCKPHVGPCPENQAGVPGLNSWLYYRVFFKTEKNRSN